MDYSALFESFKRTGFQATNLGLAIEQVKKMIFWRLSDEKPDPEKESDEYLDPDVRIKTRCTIFLGFTSNMSSCGIR